MATKKRKADEAKRKRSIKKMRVEKAYRGRLRTLYKDLADLLWPDADDDEPLQRTHKDILEKAVAQLRCAVSDKHHAVGVENKLRRSIGVLSSRLRSVPLEASVNDLSFCEDLENDRVSRSKEVQTDFSVEICPKCDEASVRPLQHPSGPAGNPLSTDSVVVKASISGGRPCLVIIPDGSKTQSVLASDSLPPAPDKRKKSKMQFADCLSIISHNQPALIPVAAVAPSVRRPIAPKPPPGTVAIPRLVPQAQVPQQTLLPVTQYANFVLPQIISLIPTPITAVSSATRTAPRAPPPVAPSPEATLPESNPVEGDPAASENVLGEVVLSSEGSETIAPETNADSDQTDTEDRSRVVKETEVLPSSAVDKDEPLTPVAAKRLRMPEISAEVGCATSETVQRPDEPSVLASDANLSKTSITHSTESIMASSGSSTPRQTPAVSEVTPVSGMVAREGDGKETVVPEIPANPKGTPSSASKIPASHSVVQSQFSTVSHAATVDANPATSEVVSISEGLPAVTTSQPSVSADGKNSENGCDHRQSPARSSFPELMNASLDKSPGRRNDAMGHSISRKIEASNAASWEANVTRASSVCSAAFTAGVDSASTTTASQSSWLHNLSWINPTISPCPEILPELSWNLNYKDTSAFDSGMTESIKADTNDGQRVPAAKDYGSFVQKNTLEVGASRSRCVNAEMLGKPREKEKMKGYGNSKNDAKVSSSAAFFSVSQLVEKNPLQTNAAGPPLKTNFGGQFQGAFSAEEKMKPSSKRDYADQPSSLQKVCVSQPSSYSTESLLKTQQPPQVTSNNSVAASAASYSPHGSLQTKQKPSRSTPSASVTPSTHGGHNQGVMQIQQPDFRRSQARPSVGFQSDQSSIVGQTMLPTSCASDNGSINQHWAPWQSPVAPPMNTAHGPTGMPPPSFPSPALSGHFTNFSEPWNAKLEPLQGHSQGYAGTFASGHGGSSVSGSVVPSANDTLSLSSSWSGQAAPRAGLGQTDHLQNRYQPQPFSSHGTQPSTSSHHAYARISSASEHMGSKSSVPSVTKVSTSVSSLVPSNSKPAPPSAAISQPSANRGSTKRSSSSAGRNDPPLIMSTMPSIFDVGSTNANPPLNTWSATQSQFTVPSFGPPPSDYPAPLQPTSVTPLNSYPYGDSESGRKSSTPVYAQLQPVSSVDRGRLGNFQQTPQSSNHRSRQPDLTLRSDVCSKTLPLPSKTLPSQSFPSNPSLNFSLNALFPEITNDPKDTQHKNQVPYQSPSHGQTPTFFDYHQGAAHLPSFASAGSASAPVLHPPPPPGSVPRHAFGTAPQSTASGSSSQQLHVPFTPLLNSTGEQGPFNPLGFPASAGLGLHNLNF